MTNIPVTSNCTPRATNFSNATCFSNNVHIVSLSEYVPHYNPVLLALFSLSLCLWLASAVVLAVARQHWALRSVGVELSAAMLAGAILSLGSVAIQALAPTTAHTCALRVICGATSWQLCLSAATLKVRVATADMFIN